MHILLKYNQIWVSFHNVFMSLTLKKHSTEILQDMLLNRTELLEGRVCALTVEGGRRQRWFVDNRSTYLYIK